MQTASRRYEFDEQDLEEIMDRLAEKRLNTEGHLRSLHADREWLVARDEDGQLRHIELR